MFYEMAIRAEFAEACGARRHEVSFADRGNDIRVDFYDHDGFGIFYAECKRLNRNELLSVLSSQLDRLIATHKRS